MNEERIRSIRAATDSSVMAQLCDALLAPTENERDVTATSPIHDKPLGDVTDESKPVSEPCKFPTGGRARYVGCFRGIGHGTVGEIVEWNPPYEKGNCVKFRADGCEDVVSVDDLEPVEPVSEPYKFQVGDRVRANGGAEGTIENVFDGSEYLSRVAFNFGAGYFTPEELTLIDQPNPPEAPDSWPGVGSKLMIGGVEYARTASHQPGRPDHFVWTGPFFTYVWILTDDQARALRHQITAEQLGELEVEISGIIRCGLGGSAKAGREMSLAREAFARLRAKAEGGSK